LAEEEREEEEREDEEVGVRRATAEEMKEIGGKTREELIEEAAEKVEMTEAGRIERSDYAVCSACGGPIAPGERAVSHPCPKCGEVVITRCQKCRRLGNRYQCPNCGFIGP